MKESATYQMILAEGPRGGRGRLDGEKEILSRLGRERFGPMNPGIEARIESIGDLDRLQKLADRLLEVSSWQEWLRRGLTFIVTPIRDIIACSKTTHREGEAGHPRAEKGRLFSWAWSREGRALGPPDASIWRGSEEITDLEGSRKWWVASRTFRARRNYGWDPESVPEGARPMQTNDPRPVPARLPAPASHEAFARANRVIPGGVNSPARAFGAVGGEPPFIERPKGPTCTTSTATPTSTTSARGAR